jgi:hypothetical protein
MKNKVGFQVGMASDLPMHEAKMLAYATSSLDWQNLYGPCIIFVDEEFYAFLSRTELDMLYQDVIPLPVEIESHDEADAYAYKIFNNQVERINVEDLYTKNTAVLSIHRKSLPENIAEKWEDLVLQEQFILSLHNSPKNN